MRTLVAIPTYNEQTYVERVLERVREHTHEVLVVDDGSTDDTPAILKQLQPRLGFRLLPLGRNAGYGRALAAAYQYADRHGFDWIITMDCDEQHEPASIPRFVEAAREDALDIVSGSRYLRHDDHADSPPPDRRAINQTVTAEINERLGLELTDSFCGFKACRVDAIRKLRLTEPGYAFPMQFWVQAVAANLRIGEIPVELIYNDPNRTFGGGLDNPEARLAHYRRVLHCELERCADRLPDAALDNVAAGCR